MTNKQIRSYALIKLKGSWGNSTAVTISFLAVVLLVGLGEYLLHLIYGDPDSVLFMPLPSEALRVGLAVFYNLAFYAVLIMIGYTFLREIIDIKNGRLYNISRNRIMQYKRLFVKVSIFPHFIKIGVTVMCAIPGVLAYDAIKSLSQAPYDKALTLFVLLFFMMSVLVVIFSICLVINSLLCLHLLPMVLMHNPLMPISQAISLCFKKAEGNKLRIISFHISFLKFLPLCLLLYPLVILLPYYVMSNIILTEDILGKELTTDIFLDVFAEKEI